MPAKAKISSTTTLDPKVASKMGDYRPATHLFSILLMFSTWCLLFVGAMVTSTNSGLSVPDWPTTFGQNMFLYPLSQMKGGIFFEHGHRLFASVVGLLALINALFLGGRNARKAVCWLSYGALLLVIVQGLFGGLTVRMKLPMLVSSAHGGLAQAFFLVTVTLSLITSKSWVLSNEDKRFNFSGPGVIPALILLVTGYSQLLIGAMMRHSYAGLAIPTFPKAFGAWIPDFWNFGLATHFIHTRIMPLILTGLLIWLLQGIWFSPHSVIRRGSRMVAVVFLLQISLGASVIWSAKAPLIASLHLTMGAALLGCILFVAFWGSRLKSASQAESPSILPATLKGATA
jgi:heme a synthase